MKTLLQKLPLDQGSSFLARTYSTPCFETPYHQHLEYELMVIKEGHGTAFVGNFIGEYQAGDVYLHGKNLPHWFRKKDSDMTGSSMVIHFSEDFLGDAFFNAPEMTGIRKLLANSSKGIYLEGMLKEKIGKKLVSIENQYGLVKLIELLLMLHEISTSEEYHFVSEAEIVNYTPEEQFLIYMVFEFTMQHFKRKIKLDEVAELTNKSVSAFCHYFKKTTKISYNHFLTRIRISHACKLLKNTDLSISEICYESGFHSWANFSKHFKEHCKMSPSRYRSSYAEAKH